MQLSPGDRRGFTAQALADAAAGRISPLVGQTYPLAEAADAHAAIEARNMFGKTILLTEA
jgi:NADPH2:quinone reductase